MNKKILTFFILLSMGILLMGFIKYPRVFAQVDESKADLDVLFIERTPRFPRYNVLYKNSSFPYLFPPGSEKAQRYPNQGQEVSFIAHVKNSGWKDSEEFQYQWFIDDDLVESKSFDGLDSNSQETFTLKWDWDNNPHNIKFRVVPNPDIDEISTSNNDIENSITALSFRFHVDQSVYHKFNSLKNIIGTYSFEDWIQYHMQKINQKIADSGGIEQVRIDDIVVEQDHQTDPGGTHVSGEDLNWDGRWGFVWQEWCGSTNCSSGKNGITEWVDKLQVALIHELAHQMGMAHSADANIDIASDNLITGQRLVQDDPAIVGKHGTDDVGWSFGTDEPLTPYFIHALNSNVGFRRGYYGDYLFDIPDQNVLVFTDNYGERLVGAEVKIWQSKGRKVFGEPKFQGYTDENGAFVLPNQPLTSPLLTTQTSHILKPNPFGDIHVIGENGMLLIGTKLGEFEDYQFLTIHNFNLAYWEGDSDEAYYYIQTSLIPNAGATNIALNKPTSASRNINLSPKIADGVTKGDNYWDAPEGKGQKGDWVLIDLDNIYDIYKVNIYSPSGAPKDMFDKFHIEVSATGEFLGEQQTIVKETQWVERHAVEQTESYTFKSASGRFIRLVADADQPWAKIQEIEVFGLNNTGGSFASFLDLPSEEEESLESTPSDTPNSVCTWEQDPYGECDWDTNQVYDFEYNSCTGEVKRFNYHKVPGQCGYEEASSCEQNTFVGCAKDQCGVDRFACEDGSNVIELNNPEGDCAKAEFNPACN